MVEDLQHKRGACVKVGDESPQCEGNNCATCRASRAMLRRVTHLLDVRAQSPREVSTSVAWRSNACLCCASFKKKSLCFVPDRDGGYTQRVRSQLDLRTRKRAAKHTLTPNVARAKSRVDAAVETVTGGGVINAAAAEGRGTTGLPVPSIPSIPMTAHQSLPWRVDCDVVPNGVCVDSPIPCDT